ncbi:hypothetical protein Hdeb2414_s0004g00140471 [Helianthus debilis subsp. tardiflorus]
MKAVDVSKWNNQVKKQYQKAGNYTLTFSITVVVCDGHKLMLVVNMGLFRMKKRTEGMSGSTPINQVNSIKAGQTETAVIDGKTFKKPRGPYEKE